MVWSCWERVALEVKLFLWQGRSKSRSSTLDGEVGRTGLETNILRREGSIKECGSVGL